MTKTQRARKALNAAQAALRKAVADDYLIGDFTKYRHGRNWIPCVVTGAPSFDGERIKVQGWQSGKEYWISTSSLKGGGGDA